jgi:hypothetical protein
MGNEEGFKTMIKWAIALVNGKWAMKKVLRQ